jgi:coenzyme F420-reducing hydrogenase alpha subunit
MGGKVFVPFSPFGGPGGEVLVPGGENALEVEELDHLDQEAEEAVAVASNALALAQKAYPNKAGRTESHHVCPVYLGGAKNGPRVDLDAAYHQMITNEFRYEQPYGQGPVSQSEQQRIMNKVYSKYPLP